MKEGTSGYFVELGEQRFAHECTIASGDHGVEQREGYGVWGGTLV